MPKLKFFLCLFLGVAVVIAQAGSALAAPSWQDDAPITGTVQSAVVEADSVSDTQTVLVTLLVNREAQSIHVSVQTAAELGLVSLDENGAAVIDESVWGSDLTIASADILFDGSVTNERDHPVGSKITEFFSGLVDVDYELVMSSRSNRFGFGVISYTVTLTDAVGSIAMDDLIVEAGAQLTSQGGCHTFNDGAAAVDATILGTYTMQSACGGMGCCGAVVVGSGGLIALNGPAGVRPFSRRSAYRRGARSPATRMCARLARW